MSTPKGQKLEGITFAEYEAIDAVSRSFIVDVLQDPYAARCRRAGHHFYKRSTYTSKAMQTGKDFDFILQHGAEAFRQHMLGDAMRIPADKVKDLITSTGKVANNANSRKVVKAWAEELGQKPEDLSARLRAPDWFQEVEERCEYIAHLRKAFLRDRMIQTMEQYKSGNQVALVWTDEDTGVKCKALLDGYADNKMLWDDKTTAVDWYRFPSHAVDFGYDIQEAHYRAGWHACTGQDLPWYFRVVQTVYPYQAYALQLDSETQAHAILLRRKALETIASWKSGPSLEDLSQIDDQPAQVRRPQTPTYVAMKREAIHGISLSEGV